VDIDYWGDAGMAREPDVTRSPKKVKRRKAAAHASQAACCGRFKMKRARKAGIHQIAELARI